jgi:hypothetical protein
MWRLVGWIIPILVVLAGLVLVATALTGNDEPQTVDDTEAIRTLVEGHAGGWVATQVATPTTSELSRASVAAKRAVTVTAYLVAAVVTRVDTVPDVGETTVTSCVLWTVDVTTGGVGEEAASELRREPGRQAPSDDDELARRCTATMPPA